MKRILFWSAVTLFAAVSCNKELENGTPAVSENNAPETFVATVEGGDDTKSVMGEITDNKAKLYWNGTETILAFGSNWTEKSYKAEGLNKQTTATFAEDNVEETLSGDNYLVVTPAQNKNDVWWNGGSDDSINKLWLPINQAAVKDSYDPAAHIAMASTNAANNNLAFKNVVSLIKFTVGNEGVTKAGLYNTDGKYLSGNFDVKYNNGEPQITTTEGAYREWANSYAGIEGSLEMGATYYIAVLPANLENGFTFEYVVDGNPRSIQGTRALDIARNTVIDLGTITIAEPVIVKKTVYFKPNADWTADGAKIGAHFWSPDVNVIMTDENNDGIYETSVNEKVENVIFVKLDSSAEVLDWSKEKARTAELTITDECYALGYSGSAGTWMTFDEAKNYTPEKPTVPVSKWAIVGSINGWNPGDVTYALVEEVDYYVYKGLTLDADSEVKFIYDGPTTGWSNNKGGGTYVDGKVDLWNNGGNIKPGAGTYDVYLKKDTSIAYFLAPGTKPAN